MKRIKSLPWSLVACCLLPVAGGLSPAFAEDPSSAEEKAKEIHRLASSDVIYQDQETKAIYYQNVQIIGLLKQIRDILDSRLKQEEAE